MTSLAIRDQVREGLDRVDALAPGSGRLELGAAARGVIGADAGWIGGYGEIDARLRGGASVFGRAEAGYDRGLEAGTYAALGGLRWRW